MAPHDIPKRAMHQDNVFFSAEWTRAMDRQFISILIQLKAEGYWVVWKKNKRASARAIGVYNGMCRTNLEPKFGIKRVRKLHKRFKVFASLIQRPWVTYDATTHSVSCLDAVWKVLYDQQMLVAPYINEGEHSYDSLRELFREVEYADYESKDIIQISSDTEACTGNDSFVVEIPNPYSSILTDTHCSGGSSPNTDSVFYNELACNYSDSETEDSNKSIYGSTTISANTPTYLDNRHHEKGRCSSSGIAVGKGQSSCASWSLFKKN